VWCVAGNATRERVRERILRRHHIADRLDGTHSRWAITVVTMTALEYVKVCIYASRG
jgi:hypothetical protein